MATQKQVQKEPHKPETKFRFGAITATVWKNIVQVPDKDVMRVWENRSVDLERSYKDKLGEWQNTPSMRAQDLPRAILALQKAFEFCVTKREDAEDESI